MESFQKLPVHPADSTRDQWVKEYIERDKDLVALILVNKAQYSGHTTVGTLALLMAGVMEQHTG